MTITSTETIVVFDEAKNVIRLRDGSEIPVIIIESIYFKYPDAPSNPYQKYVENEAFEAIIRLKRGWLWNSKEIIYASEYNPIQPTKIQNC